MSARREDLNVSAVRYRRAQGDLRMFMVAFAARLDGMIPGRVTIEKKTTHLFSAAPHVIKMTIDTEPNVYIATYDEERLSVARAKSVRGMVLKSEALTLPQWLASLAEDVRRLSDKAEAADEIFRDFSNALNRKRRSKSVLERYSPSNLVTIWSMSKAR